MWAIRPENNFLPSGINVSVHSVVFVEIYQGANNSGLSAGGFCPRYLPLRTGKSLVLTWQSIGPHGINVAAINKMTFTGFIILITISYFGILARKLVTASINN